MKKNSFSLIIPVYNSEKFLENCIDSIINQTYDNFEAIFIDDGSTDNSLSILKKYSKKDERIIFLHKPNAGVSSARNSGIDLAKNEYIIFIDSDDLLESNALDYYNNLINNNNGVEFFQTILMQFENTLPNNYNVDIKEKILTSTERKESIKKLLIGDTKLVDYMVFPGPVCKVYKRDIIEKNKLRFRNEFFMYEDGIFNLEYLLKCDSMCISNYITYFYRTNMESITHKYNPKYTSQRLLMIDYIKKIVDENNFDIKYYYMFIYQSIIDILSFNVFAKNANLTISDKRKQFNNLYNNKIIKEALKHKYYNEMVLKKKILIYIFKHKGFFTLKMIYSLFK